MQNIAPGQNIKHCCKPLAQASNKVGLIKSLVQEWRGKNYCERLDHHRKVVCVTCEEKCFRLSAVTCREVPELQCVQNKASGHLLHASHAAEDGYEAVVISSYDIDIVILNIAFYIAIKHRCTRILAPDWKERCSIF